MPGIWFLQLVSDLKKEALLSVFFATLWILIHLTYCSYLTLLMNTFRRLRRKYCQMLTCSRQSLPTEFFLALTLRQGSTTRSWKVLCFVFSCFVFSATHPVFTRVFSLALVWARRREICLLHYLDDWLVIAVDPSFLRASHEFFHHLSQDLGICHHLGDTGPWTNPQGLVSQNADIHLPREGLFDRLGLSDSEMWQTGSFSLHLHLRICCSRFLATVPLWKALFPGAGSGCNPFSCSWRVVGK